MAAAGLRVLAPGLLQTQEYARAVLSTRPNTIEEEPISVRLQRQEILTPAAVRDGEFDLG